MPPLEEDIGDGLPLILGRIYTSGVVRARMEQEHRALGCTLQGADEPIEIQTNGLGVVVAVIHRLDSDITENRVVIGYTAIRRMLRVERIGCTYPR